MITGTLLAILGFALAVVIWAMLRAPSGPKLPAPAGPRQVPAAPAPTSASGGDVWDAKKGDVISITGAAVDFSDLDFAVDRRSAYQGSVQRWVDMSGEFRGQRVYLEVYRHPQPDLIGILDPRKLNLTDIGVSEDRLAEIDTRQDPTLFLEFEAKKWNWESSREIRYFEDETGSGEGLYRWLFREQGGAGLICIEKWEGEPFEVRIARHLNERDVTMYRAGPGV